MHNLRNKQRTSRGCAQGGGLSGRRPRAKPILAVRHPLRRPLVADLSHVPSQPSWWSPPQLNSRKSRAHPGVAQHSPTSATPAAQKVSTRSAISRAADAKGAHHNGVSTEIEQAILDHARGAGRRRRVVRGHAQGCRQAHLQTAVAATAAMPARVYRASCRSPLSIK